MCTSRQEYGSEGAAQLGLYTYIPTGGLEEKEVRLQEVNQSPKSKID